MSTNKLSHQLLFALTGDHCEEAEGDDEEQRHFIISGNEKFYSEKLSTSTQ